MTCADALSPPRNEYFELDDHPAITTPYAPKDDIARTYRSPTLILATTYQSPKENGSTARALIAANVKIIGASMNTGLSTWVGIMSSLKKDFRPSAIGCHIPCGPVLIGPSLTCIC